MAEIPKSVSPMASAPHQQHTDFVALDIADLADHDSAPCSSPRVTRSFSRKSSLKPIDENGDAAAAAFSINCGSQMSEKGVVPTHAAAADESVMLSRATTPAASGAVKYRRMGSRRAASSPWFGPRRVLFVFATLSSMGTLILLYFTLSMASMSGGDADAR